MADIKMIKYHSLPLAEAKALAQKAADELGREYGLDSEWHGDTLRFKRSGVDGEMQVTNEEIRLSVQLGFLLRPFKARFVEAIEHHFDRLRTRASADRSKGKPATKPPKPTKGATATTATKPTKSGAAKSSRKR